MKAPLSHKIYIKKFVYFPPFVFVNLIFRPNRNSLRRLRKISSSPAVPNRGKMFSQIKGNEYSIEGEELCLKHLALAAEVLL
jgi:hypothetical protein